MSQNFSYGEPGPIELLIAGDKPTLVYMLWDLQGRVVVRQWDGRGFVPVVGSPISGPGVGYNHHSATDRDGNLVVAFIEKKQRVRIRRFDGEAWNNIGTFVNPGKKITDIRLALDDNTPYVLFRNGGQRYAPNIYTYSDESGWHALDPQPLTKYNVSDSMALVVHKEYLYFLGQINAPRRNAIVLARRRL